MIAESTFCDFVRLNGSLRPSCDDADVIDLTASRLRRHLLTLQQAELAEALVAGLRQAAPSLIPLARGLAASAPCGDAKFERDFCGLVFDLFEVSVFRAIGELQPEVDMRQDTARQATEIAFSYFIFSASQLVDRKQPASTLAL